MTARHTPDLARWEQATRERPRWDERNRLVAAYVPPGSAVVDLGCGAQTLREHLPDGCRYQPCDVVPGPDVIACDLAAGVWPELPRRYDVAVCSGVLEYIPDVPAVLAGLRDVAGRALVTYNDQRSGQRRMHEHGRVSFLTLADLRAALDALEADWRFLTEWRGHVIAGLDFDDGLAPWPDGDALVEDAAWETSFAGLEAHARRTGSAAVAKALVVDGHAVGAWAEAQRRLRRRGTLSTRRAARLEALPSWSWRAPRRGAPVAAAPVDAGPEPLRARRVTRERGAWVGLAAARDPVLDLQGAAGGTAVALARAGLKVTAFDADVTAVAQLRARLSEEGADTRARVTLVTGEGLPLPFDDDAFEAVLVGGAVERDGAAPELLAEVARVLRPDGRVVVTVALDGEDRPALPALLELLAPRLRPVELVDGERWLGIVAVAARDAAAAAAAWPALLDVAERRLRAVESARAAGAAELAQAHGAEAAAARRAEDLAGALARAEEQRDGLAERLAAAARRTEELERTVARADGERAALGRRLEEQAATAEREREAARAAQAELEARREAEAARLHARLAEVREDGRLLFAEHARVQEQLRGREQELGRAAAELATLTERASAAETRAGVAAERTAAAEARASEAEARTGEAEARTGRAEARATTAEGRAVAAADRAAIAESAAEAARAEAAAAREEAAAEAEGSAEHVAAAQAEAAEAGARAAEAAERAAAAEDRARTAALREEDAVRRADEAEAVAARRATEADELREGLAAARAGAGELRDQMQGAYGEAEAARATTEKVRAEVERLTQALERERDRSARRAAQLERIRATRSFRFGLRLWRIRRRILHPRGGGRRDPGEGPD